MEKYARVRDASVSRGLIRPGALVEPAPAGWDELALVHTAEYLEKTRCGGFRASELALLELPWSRPSPRASGSWLAVPSRPPGSPSRWCQSGSRRAAAQRRSGVLPPP